MTHISFSIYSPKSQISSMSFTLGKKTPLTYDELVVGFATALGNFMLNNETITESDLIAAVSRVCDALASISIQEQSND